MLFFFMKPWTKSAIALHLQLSLRAKFTIIRLVPNSEINELATRIKANKIR